MGGSYSCDGSTKAALGAASQALLGTIGLGSLAEDSDDPNSGANKLAAANDALTKLQQVWTDRIESAKTKITEDQISYLQNLLDFSDVESALISEKLYEQEGRNTILIGMLLCLVIFLILFDIL